MATKNGWWSFSTNVEPSELDLEHISELIRQGFTSGEIIKENTEQYNNTDCCKTCLKKKECNSVCSAVNNNQICTDDGRCEPGGCGVGYKPQ